MARFKTFSAINIDDFNLYFYQSAYDGDEIIENDPGYWSAGGFTTATYDEFYYGYGLSDTNVSWALGAAGADFFYDGYASGTANAISEWNDGGTGNWVINWILDGVSVSLSDLIEAVTTPTPLDDLILLSEALSGSDIITLSDFDDVFSGFGGRDTIYGGSGGDVLYGERGSDTLYGGAGGDDLYGGAGSDKLLGDANDDYLNGGAGNDTLQGGASIDYAWGGPGLDTFVYKRVSEAPINAGTYDTIGYLSTGNDRISLVSIDANTAAAATGNQTFSFIGTVAFNGSAGQLRYDVIDVDSDGDLDVLVFGTVNADTTADFAIAALDRTSIEATDFLL